MLADLRYALRILRKQPGFAVAAVLTLALGIGANTAIFSLVSGVLLRQLPYAEPDRLVMIFGGDQDGQFSVSEQELIRYREQDDVFQSVAGFSYSWATLSGDAAAERVLAGRVNARLVEALGVSPLLGRTFDLSEDAQGNNAVAMLSYELWQRRFGGDPDVVGKTLVAEGITHDIVGVLPPDFRLPLDFVGSRAELFVPLALGSTPDPRNIHYLQAVGLLQRGIGLAEAQGKLRAFSTRLRDEIGTLPPTFEARLVPLTEQIFGDIRPVLLILLGATGIVLLVACVNVANLMLARGDARSREIAVRAALGAGRFRLIRQSVTESLTLAMLGGAVGIVVAAWIVQTIVFVNPWNIPRLDEVGLDVGVLLFSGVLSVAAGIGFGLFPAFQLTRRDVQESLHLGTRGAGGEGSLSLRRALVTTQMALAVMLAIGAGLLVRSALRLNEVERGFVTEKIFLARLALPGAEFPQPEGAREFYRSLLESLRGQASVSAAAAVSHVPLLNGPGDWGIRIEGREEERLPGGRRPYADWVIASDGYFETLGIQLVVGRTFTPQDDSRAVPVVVINETASRRYWGTDSPIGARFRLTTDIDQVYRTVIGVVADIRQDGLDEEVQPTMYLPLAQFPGNPDYRMGNQYPGQSMALVVKTTGDPLAITPLVRREVASLNRGIPVSGAQSMVQVVSGWSARRRMNALLFSSFGLLALVLGAVGVYGINAYAVARRTQEFGVRLALGSTPREMVRLVLHQGLTLALLGVLLGTAAALALSQLLTGLLFGIGSRDLITFSSVPLFLVVVAFAACYIPARRASNIDPIKALRYE